MWFVDCATGDGGGAAGAPEAAGGVVGVGLGRIVTLYYRPSTLYQIR